MCNVPVAQLATSERALKIAARADIAEKLARAGKVKGGDMQRPP